MAVSCTCVLVFCLRVGVFAGLYVCLFAWSFADVLDAWLSLVVVCSCVCLRVCVKLCLFVCLFICVLACPVDCLVACLFACLCACVFV